MSHALTIIVPVHRGGAELRQCLESLALARAPEDEVIVVVDGGDPAAVELGRALAEHVISVPTRRGPAYARNRGADQGRNPILFFVDADVVATRDTLDHIRHDLDDDKIDAVIGSYDDQPGHPALCSQYRNLLHHFVHQSESREVQTFWTACGAVDRAVFFALGGFDEAIGIPAMEDIEFGYRLTAAGFRIRLCPVTQVKHLKLWTPWTMFRTDIFQRAIPWTVLALRYRRFGRHLNLNWRNQVSVGLTGLGVVLLGLSPLKIALAPAGFGCLMLSLVPQSPFFGFLCRKRGLFFCLRSVPLQLLHHLSAGLGWLLGHLVFLRAHLCHDSRDPSARAHCDCGSGSCRIDGGLRAGQAGAFSDRLRKVARCRRHFPDGVPS